MEDSRDGGILSDGEAEIIERAFEFADKKASDVMVPASKVNFVSLQHSFNENIDLIGKTRHARLPLCKENLEDLLGIIHTKDFWPLLSKESSNDLFQKIAHKPLVVPSTMKQDDVFKFLQGNRTHLAVVQNESGKNIGIITLEDVLEGLVGEFEERRFE